MGGRAAVRATTAFDATVEIQHVLPGEVLERFHPQGFQAVELHVRDAVHHRLDVAGTEPQVVSLTVYLDVAAGSGIRAADW